MRVAAFSSLSALAVASGCGANDGSVRPIEVPGDHGTIQEAVDAARPGDRRWVLGWGHRRGRRHTQPGAPQPGRRARPVRDRTGRAQRLRPDREPCRGEPARRQHPRPLLRVEGRFESRVGETSSAGNCFVDNEFHASLPASIEDVLACEGAVAVDGPWVVEPIAAPGPVDHRALPLPPDQPSRPGDPTEPPAAPAGFPGEPDLDAVTVPGAP